MIQLASRRVRLLNAQRYACQGGSFLHFLSSCTAVLSHRLQEFLGLPRSHNGTCRSRVRRPRYKLTATIGPDLLPEGRRWLRIPSHNLNRMLFVANGGDICSLGLTRSVSSGDAVIRFSTLPVLERKKVEWH